MRHADSSPPSTSTSPDSPTAARVILPQTPSAKVQDHHLQRQAIVYVRQSTLQQVANNRESTQRQYALDQRAIQLGWSPQQVTILDDDQGLSGQTAEGRPGFQSMLAQIALDRVGIVLGLEMSRLARSNKDWHQLLEVCGIFGTLLADADGVYDPTDYNDRLLLGLKGTISEAELHVLRTRMHQGLLNKARRGEVYNHPPIGYVKAATGGFALDPDEQVQSVVRLLFEQFDRQGTVCGLLRYLVKHNVRIPVRPHHGDQRGQLQWHRPNRVTLQSLLHHPIYAGFYRWGHRAVDSRKKVPGRRQSGITLRPPKDSLVLLPNHCPAYISADQFWANQMRLEDNRTTAKGPVRNGPALLSGLLVCGRCGYHMTVNYNNAGRFLRYGCNRIRVCYGQPSCQSLSGKRLDELVARQVLAALQPAVLELHLAAAVDVEKQRQLLHRNWQQQIERARYEAERAERQYQQVEPENRLVARELERRWEAALSEQRRREQQYQEFCALQPAQLSEAEREQIRRLAEDVPQLWNASTTTPADRQRLMRLLIDKVVVELEGHTDQVKVGIEWSGGFVSHHPLVRCVQRYDQLADYPRLCQRIEQLCDQNLSLAQVAQRLNQEGFHPPRNAERFTGGTVERFRYGLGKGGCRRRHLSKSLKKDEWLLRDLASHLRMPVVTLHKWRKAGWLRARKLEIPGVLWAVSASAAERKRLARLRQHQTTKLNQPIPEELKTPLPQSK
jgi:DNA invertase Pin-like site-specific DNA recombinase